MTRLIDLSDADPSDWVPMRLMKYNMEPWVNRGAVVFAYKGEWDARAPEDYMKWPRVQGKYITDDGYEENALYAIPVPSYCLGELGTTIFCPQPKHRLVEV